MNFDITIAAEKHREKLSKIKLFLSDVDGVLTDSNIYWAGDEIGWNRSFNIADGYGLKLLSEAGIKTGIITAGKSSGVISRFKSLGVDYIKCGNHDKRQAYLDIIEDCKVADEEVLYIGDEFFDIPLLKKVGFSASVSHASPEVKNVCDFVVQSPAGRGCVRELIEMLRYVTGFVPNIPDFE